LAQHSATNDARPNESENVALVQNFFADWTKRDAALLATYMSDDFSYQMIEGEPDLIGPAMFIKTLGTVLPGFTEIDMRIRRIVGYGHIVIVDRFDRMIGKDAAHSMCFEVVAMLIVRDGKITTLRDYPIPGGVFELGDAWLTGGQADESRLQATAETGL
jgi:limonene-1,2-epoxide hydrolase